MLLFDLRGHGQSDPSRLYLGRRERGDIRAVMAWAFGEGFTHDRIGWLGYSMGGSTVLMEAAKNPQIHAAVLDSPYGNLPKLLNTQLPQHSGLPSWFNPGILLAARWVYGVRTDDLIPTRFARAWGDLRFAGHSRRIRQDRSREPGQRAGDRCRSLLPDEDVARRRSRPSLSERPRGLRAVCRDVLQRQLEPMNEDLSPLGRARGENANRPIPGGDSPDGPSREIPCGDISEASRNSVRPRQAWLEDRGDDVSFRSRTAAAVCTERRHVRWLVEQPEPLPLVTRLPKVF